MTLITALIPSFIVILAITLLEHRAGRGSGDWWNNLQSLAITMVGGLSVYTLVHQWQGPALIDGAKLPAWAAVVLFVLVQDLGENLFHRAQHRVGWLWEMHSLHHSDPDMAVLTTFRHFWADKLLKTVTIWSAAAFIISPTPAAVGTYFFLSQWNFVAHANLDWNFGKWSWVINSPAYHRRHHSSAVEHYDSNFAALFPFWDLLLGGYHVPEGYYQTGFERRPHNLFDQLIWPFARRRAVAAEASSEVTA